MTQEVLTEIQTKSGSGNIARRSLSIFSRKGHDVPSPTGTQSLALASIALASPSAPTATCIESQSPTKPSTKKWRIIKSSPPQQQGTILRLVPKEVPPPAMSALEIEMQTSPNDEILRNIGLSPEQSPERSSSPVEPIYFHKNPDSALNSRRLSRKEKRTSQNSIIGVWKDGSVAWDSKRRSPTEGPLPASIDALLDVSSLTGPEEVEVEGRSGKPKIQVVIPQRLSRHLSLPTYLPQIPLSEELKIDGLNIEIDSAHLKVPGHQRSHSSASSSEESVLSDEEKTSSTGRSSNRSSITSLDSESSSPSQQDLEKLKNGSVRSSRSDGSPELGAISDSAESEDTPNEENQRLPSLLELVDIVRTPSTRAPHIRVNRSCSGSVNPMSTLRENEEETFDSQAPSPTLSEAERSLETHLSTISQVHEWRTGSLKRNFSIPRKPAPPPKSAKRLSRHVSQQLPLSSPRGVARSPSVPTIVSPASPTREAPAPPVMLSPVSPSRPAPPPPPPKQTLRRSSSVRSCLSLVTEDEDREITSDDAEKVIYHILSNITDLDDLFNMAVMNNGFYRVFKNNELEIMQRVLKNMSPAAWEFKEHSLYYDDEEPDSAIPAPEYTPASYYSSYLRDSRTLANIKALIHERCQSIIRSSTASQLLHHGPLHKSSVDDALWRIWTFTKIFGCSKGREDDVSTQMDWLRGGVVAHQTTAQSSFSSSDSWFATSAMLSASEHFAMGNVGGLSAEELYDILELWNCLRLISGGIIGKTELARQYGVYDDSDVRGGDIDGEELMLEEWHNYLLTLGMAVILQISEAETSQAAFEVAKANQWTRWSAPAPGSSNRANFLRESVSRLYEERICECFSPAQSRYKEMREIRRRRTSSLAVELKNRKADPANEFPLVTVEVPISRANTVLEHLTTPSSSRHQSIDFSNFPGDATQRLSVHSAPPNLIFESPIVSPMEVHPLLRAPSYSPPSPPERQPSPPSMQHPFQVLMNSTDASVNSSEKAIFRIMEMGFTSDEAKGALKITDMGDGLRVDRAVEYLLRQQDAY